MSRIPDTLRSAMAPVTVVCGHYGVGKTNFSVNLAVDLAADGLRPTVIDLDVVNPYFRASEQRELLEARGIRLVAPVFAERGTSLDVPSLTAEVAPAIELADEQAPVIIDVGGDDVGAAALGRFARIVSARPYAMLYVVNRHRNLIQDPSEAQTILREVEEACHLRATALVDNAHLRLETTEEALADPAGYADRVSELCRLPLVAKTYPQELLSDKNVPRTGSFANQALAYPITLYVKNPWE